MSERRLIAAAAGFGVLCRVRLYLADLSLWHDESFVALNVLHTPLGALLGGLDWHEPSPPGFLAVEQAVVALVGGSEAALRAVPLLAGVVALLLFARLAPRLCRGGGAGWAVLLLAASPKLIAAAGQVKHFSLDLLTGLALLGLATSAVQDRSPRPRLLLAWGAVAALGMWVSYATAFGFAAGVVVLGAGQRRWPRPSRRAFAAALGAGLVAGAALIPALMAQRGDAVVGFWQRAFADLSGPWSSAVWMARALVALFDYFWQPLGGVLLLLALVAAASHWRAREARPVLALLWLPVGAALAASALHWWPFGGNQHMAFAAPAVLVLAGDGLEIVCRRVAARRPRLAWTVVVLVLAPGLAASLANLVIVPRRHDLRAAIAFARANAAAGDQVAVFDEATYAFYTGRDQRGATRQFDAGRRVWVITPRSTHGEHAPGVDATLDALLQRRPRLLGFEPDGAAAYCFGVER